MPCIPNLNRRFRAFQVAPEFFNEFRALVEIGTPPSHALGIRLERAKNYKACLDSILAELSQPVIQTHFPPASDHFESLSMPARGLSIRDEVA